MPVLQTGLTKSAAEAYTIDQSLRFEDGDSAYLSRTPGSAGNRTTYTLSCWVKRANLSTGYQVLFSAGSGSEDDGIAFLSDDRLAVWTSVSSTHYSTAKYRDVGAWYHIVIAVDTNDGTPADRVKIYVNGSRLTAFDTETNPDSGATGYFNDTDTHTISRWGSGAGGTQYLDGYLAEVYWIDGTQCDADDFGKLDSGTNQWIPKDASGLTFGTNGFYQKYGSSGGHTSFTTVGSTTWTAPAGITSVDYLVVAGGGGGGMGSAHGKCSGGGGGAGGMLTGTLSVTPSSSYTVTVGDGGAGNTNVGSDGGDSVFSSITATGGGGGGGGGVDGRDGGSGGGGDGEPTAGGASTSGQGNAGAGGNATGVTRGGGGGGKGGAGNDSGSEGVGGAGGAGEANSITGSSVTYAGGGGGAGGYSGGSGTGGAGGSGGGGAGAGTGGGTAGTANTGSGGGGGSGHPHPTGGSGGNGGSGIVVIKPASGFGFGLDSSGEGNNFTVTNLVATDQMVDTPTNNLMTLNPLDPVTNVSYAEGNLAMVTDASVGRFARTTMPIPEGKWIYEYYIAATNDQWYMTGMQKDGDSQDTLPGYTTNGYAFYLGNGKKVNSSTQTTWGNSVTTTGKTVMIAIHRNGTSLKIWAGHDEASTGTIVWQGSGDPANGIDPMYDVTIAVTDTWWMGGGNDGNLTQTCGPYNFGQSDFTLTVPTDFQALTLANLDDPEIALPTDHFNTKLYTGDGATTLAVSGVGFQPDFTWIKNRDQADDHTLVDSVRGATNYLVSNETDAEVDDSTFVASLDSDGFTVGDDVVVNTSTEDYASWNWKAGGTAASNTDGTITSSVSANPTAGFSIVSYTGNETTAQTVGHGLSSAPELVIIKARNNTTEWAVGSDELTSWSYYLYLNDSRAEVSTSTVFGNAPSASVFKINDATASNGAYNFIAYCFHSVEGYSKVGSYVGNGDNDGTFVYTGFRPMWVMAKCSDQSGSWLMTDSVRFPYNVTEDPLFANENSAETNSSTYAIDILSNGFKCRGVNNNTNNSSDDTYIYLAFAESPFKYSNAR